MSGNNKSQRRSIISAQSKMRELNIRLDTNPATPVVTGYDSKQIKEVIDNGVGDVTIVFLKPFQKDNVLNPIALLSMQEPDLAAHTYASDYDRISIRITDLAAVASEGSISLCIKGCDNRFNY